ncbi:uncharacterized protein cubi_02489 [Cryptosporidium ubiquitum]|uniref:Uncharacterized protein n=1 Tax=Cryptosporidium ubiquitum TaxID=857276 RepID=A0A1J4MGA9_9CRYT|nr:uncharacterized protein cubi_02489 [Cryptosporidium ubiquitum]OII73257.1 hypothetical protein cubi_02489 [Cryptosporidium ubiquitum]
MKYQSRKENHGENKESGDKQSSSLIDSLRVQISKVSALNRFRFINGNKKPFESENEVQIGDIADKIRNKISINRLSKSPELDSIDGNHSEHIGDSYSPFRKRNKNSERSLLQDKMTNFAQSRSELENLLLYNINKLRREQIKLRNYQLNKNNTQDENEILFPNIYTPLSSMKFMNIQELYLFLSLFYQNGQAEQTLANLNNLQIIFFTPESTSTSNSSTIITGRYTKILDDEYLFLNNASASKFILNSTNFKDYRIRQYPGFFNCGLHIH